MSNLINIVLDFVTGMAQEFEELLKGLKPYSKYYNGYVYLIVEVDNPLVDSLIDFVTKVFILSNRSLKVFHLSAHLNSNLRFPPT